MEEIITSEEVFVLETQVATLNELLAVQEKVVIDQSTQLEQAQQELLRQFHEVQAAELKLKQYAADLEQANQELHKSRGELDIRVRERTAELEQANEQLRQAQTDLVQSEKMSMLGGLAAGVAHEINTPTGAILNVIADSYAHLRELVNLEGTFGELPPDTHNWLRCTLDEVFRGPVVRSEPALRAARRQVEDQLRRSDDGVQNIRRIAEVAVSCGFALNVDGALLKYLAQEPVLAVLEHALALKAAVDISQSSAKKIARIVRALRFYSREGNASPAWLDVNESIENTLVILQHRLKHIAEVVVSLGASLPPVSSGPELAQVWTNILNNACDAIEMSKSGGMGRIDVTSRLDGGQVIVTVSNSGPPIPEDVMQKMYAPFFTTKPLGSGTGLGLSICVNILGRCGGGIATRNEEGRVTFEVTIPACRTPVDTSAPDQPAIHTEVGETSQ